MWLDKDVEQFKKTLQQDIEQFKHTLERASVEHHVRFSKLHDARAEVLKETYRLLVLATHSVENHLHPV